ncbi:MAG: Crp/Fnr family transcriptional regulator [Bacteroidota bacterium]
MLDNRDVFKRLMKLLRSLARKPLPPELDEVLWNEMMVLPYFYKEDILEDEGQIPGHAYYVVSGYVMVYAWCSNGYRYLFRIYRENTIVAFKDFMNQDKSRYQIVACRNTRVWSVSNEVMTEIYKNMDGMREMALNTVLEYSDSKEKLRNDLLALDTDDRVLAFYKTFEGLLPARTGPIRDMDIADFLVLTIDELREARKRLKKRGLL